MTVDPDFPAKHTFNVAFSLLRFWLGLLIVGMISSATSARPVLLDDPLRPIPYFLIVVTAMVWWANPRSPALTHWCGAIIVTLLGFRAVELAVFGDGPLSTRRAPVTLWLIIAGTWVGIAKLMAHFAGQRAAVLQLRGEWK